MASKLKNSTRRLFLVCGFDTRNHIRKTNDTAVVDESLVLYIQALSELGDVTIYMDNDLTKTELKKLAPYTVYAAASVHGEYDFGSYKRCYDWAQNNLNLADYDWVYMVNDSVYGPLYPLKPMLEKLESSACDASGLVYNAHHDHPHLQSWFLGMAPQVFLSNQFETFITGVKKHEKDKGLITKLYEQGFTRMLENNNWSYAYAFRVTGHGAYNQVKKLFKHGLPFMKKVAFTRHNGALGRQVLYILNHISPQMRNAMINDARRVYGTGLIERNLTNNPLKIIWRNIQYSLNKIFNGGI